jgi:hypothetical protein
MATTPTPIPGLPDPDPLEQQQLALDQTIGSGVAEVRFQDRTVRYPSAADLILRANYLAQLQGGGNNAANARRQVRAYTNKGL